MSTLFGVDETPGGSTPALDDLLTIMDRTAANLERLQAVWERAEPLLLDAGSLWGSTPECDDLAAAWKDLIRGLPPIDGWTITEPLPDPGTMRAANLDYDQVRATVEASAVSLATYRRRLNNARRQAVRERMQDLVATVDTRLPQLITLVDASDDDQYLDDPRVSEIGETIAEIERLMGTAAQRRGRWGDLHRHLHFGQGHDWHDIQSMDWPSVKPDIEAAMFSEVEPLPVPDIDLGRAAAQRPQGAASTALAWDRLSPDQFEHLLHDLLRHLPGYQNVQLLMKANAADRGRDLSVERVIQDGSGSVRTERVIVQAKHWLSKSVPPEEVHSTLVRIRLWEPPVIRGLVVATSGHFTPDAVAWVEKHNDSGNVPLIELWPTSRLITLLSERPWLIAEYGLR